MLNSLLNKFKERFPEIETHTLKNVLLLALLFLKQETVNLNKLKKSVGELLGNTDTKPESHYKRLHRLFENNKDNDELWQLILEIAHTLFKDEVKYLVMDGTKWSLGEQCYHFMMLGAVYQGQVIPLWWDNLLKKGISNEHERVLLFEEVLIKYRLKDKVLLADREYIGEDWFNHLQTSNIGFIIRLRKGIYKDAVNNSSGYQYDEMERRCLKRKNGIRKKIQLGEQLYTLIMVKNMDPDSDEPILYLLTTEEGKITVARAYAMRWMIENCFKNMKSNGFHLEAISLRDEGKIQLMMAILVLAYCLALFEGLKQLKVIRKKRYKNGAIYLEESVFRRGINSIYQKPGSIVQFIDYILDTGLLDRKRQLLSHKPHVQ
ncbi:transposase [Algivirga pacifica]|uniref:Transposase IS4-like domain-containing protein n=1 Tax=Algivirga pacifica TaxID=1162670 RepID=A0ABP9DEB3_9BACT